MTKFEIQSKNRSKVIAATILGTALLWGNSATAQDSAYYEDPIYPALQKIILPLEPVQLTLDSNRAFLYLKETQELDRLLVHMIVNKNMTVEVLCHAPPHSQEIAHLRADIVRGYLADNGADLSRIEFVEKSNSTDTIQIRATHQ